MPIFRCCAGFLMMTSAAWLRNQQDLLFAVYNWQATAQVGPSPASDLPIFYKAVCIAIEATSAAF
jgi:hypothetical protein